MTPFEYIRDCVITRIKPSGVHGVGVFAIKNIKKGEFVFNQWLGETVICDISYEEFKKLDIEQQFYLRDMFYKKNKIRLTNGCYFIFAIPFCFMNWSDNGIGNINGLTGEALRDIAKGEELFTQFVYDGNKTII